VSYLALFKAVDAKLRAVPDPAVVATVLQLPVAHLACLLEVRVPWLPRSLWFVPNETAVELLLSEGVSRGRIWTKAELLDLLSITGNPRTAQRLAVIKAEFDGDLVKIRDGLVDVADALQPSPPSGRVLECPPPGQSFLLGQWVASAPPQADACEGRA
jgi:hypothetical protein